MDPILEKMTPRVISMTIVHTEEVVTFCTREVFPWEVRQKKALDKHFPRVKFSTRNLSITAVENGFCVFCKRGGVDCLAAFRDADF